jgi:hypothetical protein
MITRLEMSKEIQHALCYGEVLVRQSESNDAEAGWAHGNHTRRMEYENARAIFVTGLREVEFTIVVIPVAGIWECLTVRVAITIFPILQDVVMYPFTRVSHHDQGVLLQPMGRTD